MLGVEDLPHADLKVSMKNYMKEIGLTEKELNALRTNLKGEE